MSFDGSDPWVARCGDTVRIAIRAVPGAAKTEISGCLGNELKVRIAAAPEKGKANKELENFFSDLLSVPKRNVVVVKGLSSRSKTLAVAETSLADVLSAIHDQIT